MRAEMEALEKNETRDAIELPREKCLVGCKWVFIVKYKVNGCLKRYKARLVAKCYTQTYGVTKMNIVRVLFSLAAQLD